jgi:hypothetical protein
MKRKIIVFALCCAVLPSFAQTSPVATASNLGTVSAATLPAPTSFAVVERGPHHKIWERTVYEVSPGGRIVGVPHRYTELATGLSYRDSNGQWADSQELIEASPEGAIARHGQHKVIFANNLTTAGAIDMQTPDGKRLRSNIIGLSYYDTAGGKNVLIAEVKDCQGRIVAPNQVIYSDAFTDISASIRYTYTRAGFEQDVILQEQPPAPEAFGLNSATTVLQVLTEFLNPPQPTHTQRLAARGTDPSTGDEDLDFGVMKMGNGKVFSLDQLSAPGDVPSSKQWLKLDGRDVLVEQVPVPSLRQQFQSLPKAEGASLQSGTNSLRRTASAKRLLPAARAATETSALPMQAASLKLPRGSLVLDYTTMATSATNYVFCGDMTYYISDTVNLYGTNTWEGNSVIKFASGTCINLMSVGNSKLNFLSTAYRPVVFTAKDDNTVGESFGSGSPTGYYAATALSLNSVGPQALSYARFCYVQQAIVWGSSTTLNAVHCQFLNCQNGFLIAGGTVLLENALFCNVQTNFNTPASASIIAQNVTFSQSVNLFRRPAYQGALLALTNCILADVQNLTNVLPYSSASLVGDHNGFYNSPLFGNNQFTSGTYPFQTVGGGAYYLAGTNGFRDVGVTNIDPSLLAALREKTTYPPIVYSNTTVSTATLFPQAQRNTDVPDLGYHYEPLDYVFGGTYVTTNLTFAPGTAVGWFRAAGTDHGISMANQQILTFDGRADAPNYFVRYNNVQEGCSGTWAGGWGPGGIIGTADQYLGDVSLSPEIHARFTRWSVFPAEAFFRDDYGYLIARAKDCEFWDGNTGGYGTSAYCTNCLFDRTGTGIGEGWPGNEMSYQNCTWHGGNLGLTPWSTSVPASVKNCAFDGTIIDVNADDLVNPDFDYNAFTNDMTRFPTGGGHDVGVGDTFNWQTSWLGNYYLPTNSPLIDTGSTSANLLGLYHFTTQTNQVKETDSIVDIGYHYVAVNANGNPIDTDVDGVPDYLEDANGNGLLDSGETNWQDPNDLGLKVIITHPKNNSNIP